MSEPRIVCDHFVADVDKEVTVRPSFFFARRTAALVLASGVIIAGLVPTAVAAAEGTVTEGTVQTLFDFEDGVDRHIQWEAAGAGIQDVAEIGTNQQNADSTKALSYGFDLAAAPGYGGIGFEFSDAAQDWSAYDGVQFWVYGDATDATFQVELLDASAAADPAGTYERWDLVVPVGAPGWRLVTLAWDQFTRASDFQDAGASTDGVLDLNNVRGILFPANAGTGVVKIDDIALFSAGTAVLPTVGAAASTLDVAEGEEARVEVRLSRAIDRDVTVGYATQDGSAESPRDFVAAEGTLTIPSGSTSAEIVISTEDNGDVDGNRGFEIVLADANGATLGVDAVTVTIRDDETGGGEPAPDYTAVIDFETPLVLADPEASPPLGWFTAQGTDNVPSFERVTAEDRPGAAVENQALEIGLNASSWAVLIDAFAEDGAWTTQDWSAYGGLGFWMKGGNTGAPLFVDLLDNRSPDSVIDDAERFTVTFADDWNGWRFVQFSFEDFVRKNVNNGAPDDGFTLSEMHGFAIGIEPAAGLAPTLQIDDVAVFGDGSARPVVASFPATSFAVSESEDAEVTVALSRASEKDVTVSYATEAEADRLSAVPDRDYVESTGTVTIPAGERTATIHIPTLDDVKYERDETFVVRMGEVVGAEEAPTTITRVRIVDNEDAADFAHLIDDFEQGTEGLMPSGDAVLQTRGIEAGTAEGYEGQAGYENVLDITGSGGYERNFAEPEDWSESKGIGLWYRGVGDGQPVTLTVNEGEVQPTGVEDWTLAWADEFDSEAGSPADSRYWTYETGGHGWGNDELQYYTDSTDNAAHDGDGNLVITMREVEDPESSGLDCWYGPCQFTSARLITENKVELKHGRIETRVKLPDGEAGIWPAFWALGSDFREVDWPQTGEIDVMEFVGKLPNEVFGTIHGPGYSGGASIGDIHDFGENLGGEWMTFSVEWEENVIRWYAQREGEEAVQFFEVTPDGVAPNEWVFEHPFFFIANMAIGGNFGGPLSPDLTFPQEYALDYVRVYQAPDTAERFEATFTDDTEGWRFVEIPFTELARSGEQPEGALDDGLNLTSVQGYAVSVGEAPAMQARALAAQAAPVGSVSIDQVQLLAETTGGADGDGGADGGGEPAAAGPLADTGGSVPGEALLISLLLAAAGAIVALRRKRTGRAFAE